MNLHVDQQTLDRWRADGRWVMFGAADAVDAARYATLQTSEPPGPPAWMTEAAKSCETCEGSGKLGHESWHAWTCHCDNGAQRHTITVPCDHTAPHLDPNDHGNDRGIFGKSVCRMCFGRPITVPELAVVEWGPTLIDERIVAAGDHLFVVTGDPDNNGLTQVPPDIDPQALIGQYAIGGKLVTP